jgi:hypothetical protein
MQKGESSLPHGIESAIVYEMVSEKKKDVKENGEKAAALW